MYLLKESNMCHGVLFPHACDHFLLMSLAPVEHATIISSFDPRNHNPCLSLVWPCDTIANILPSRYCFKIMQSSCSAKRSRRAEFAAKVQPYTIVELLQHDANMPSFRFCVETRVRGEE